MLLEALEILQSAGQNEDTFVTDFAIYKVIYILTVYVPLIISTFLFSQEYLGDKIACFAPENFTDAQAEATKEFCWNNGYWISTNAIPKTKSLYTQPHRFYPLYLPIQAVIMMIPIVFWNIWTKTRLMAVLRGTEGFLEDLHDLMSGEEGHNKELADKVLERIKQFHETCVSAARTSGLAWLALCRIFLEVFLTLFMVILQFFIYNHKTKEYVCIIPHLHGDKIMCTVPILDLLDLIWSINLSCLVVAFTINFYMISVLYRMHFSEFQPLFYNNLPYGDTDNFNERVTWDSRWTKDSYRLLTKIFQENNSIMTRTYVLTAMKPASDDDKNSAFEKDEKPKSVERKDATAEALRRMGSPYHEEMNGSMSPQTVRRRIVSAPDKEEPGRRRSYVQSVGSTSNNYAEDCN